jgi:hypothetical protein
MKKYIIPLLILILILIVFAAGCNSAKVADPVYPILTKWRWSQVPAA